MPAGWFQSLNAVFIVMFAPVFAGAVGLARQAQHMDPSTPVKFALGLLGMAASFLVMVSAANVVAGGAQAAAYWLVLTYLLHTYGELCLSPVGLSSVTKLVPTALRRPEHGRVVPRHVARQSGRRRDRR
ncbi:MAG: hypothetical protein R3E65_11995 [Steroidobacteraceae bacterium]